MTLFTRRAPFVIVTAMLLLPLLAYVYGAVYIRRVVDDYCNINTGRTYGVIGAVAYFYNNWGGRFTHIFTLTGILLAGLPATILATVVLLFIWWIGLFAVFANSLRRLAWDRPKWHAAIMASLLTLATLDGAFNLMQSLYWAPGSFQYFISLVFLPVFVWLILQQPIQAVGVRRLVLTLCALIPLASAGFLEIWGLIQTLGLILACAVGLRRRELRPFLPGLALGLIGSGIGFVLTFIAPGNFVRLSTTPKPDLIAATVGILVSPGILAGITFRFSPVTTILIVLLPALVGFYNFAGHARNLRRYLWIIPGVFWMITCAYFSLPFYATANPPPERAWIIPQFLLCFGLMLWGFIFGASLRRKPRPVQVSSARQALMAVLLIGVALVSASKASDALSRLADHAAAWDQREGQLVQQQNQPVTVSVAPIPNVFLLEDMSTDSTYWINMCMARYYGVTAIEQTARPAS